MNLASAIIAARLPLAAGVRVLERHPCGLLALFKPAGLLSHPNKGESDKGKCLLEADYDYAGEYFSWKAADGRLTKVHLLNRLDSPTSGVILVALNEAVATEVRSAFARGKVHKTYLAVIKGQPIPLRGFWRDRIKRQRTSTGHLRVQPGQTLEASTRYMVNKSSRSTPTLSLIELYPLTGRTHQLRVQCAMHKYPILGDKTYGRFSFNREIIKEGVTDRLYLHAEAIKLQFKLEGETIHFQAKDPAPEEFRAIVNGTNHLKRND